MPDKVFTCPTPDNINPLSPVGFLFNISKLPQLSFFCQEVNLPGLTLGEPEFITPFARVPIPGETLSYEQLTIQFLIDEEMQNYKSIYNWLVGLGFPENYTQYVNFKNTDDINTVYDLSTNYSDASLIILNNNNTTSQEVLFRDVFPVALDSIQFQSDQSDINYLVGRATFRFSYYTFT